MLKESRILENLFESRIKVKLIKIFLRNQDKYFSLEEIIKKTKEDSSSVRYQLKKLIDIGFVKTILTKKIKIKNHYTNEKIFSKNRRFFLLNKDFKFLEELNNIFSKSTSIEKSKFLEKLKSFGKLKLVLLSGIFINREDTRVDLLIVGDGIDEVSLSQFMAEIEDEVGKEIRYAYLETNDFYYRLDMFDNFIKTVLEEPSEIVLDELGIKSQFLPGGVIGNTQGSGP